MVRPHREYRTVIWSPYRRMNIRDLESVQRYATRAVPNLCTINYPDRLHQLDLPTLYFRRLRGDMIECFKIVRNFYDPSVSPDLNRAISNLRGHNFKLYKNRANHEGLRHFFTHRIVDVWNGLPSNVVNAPSTNSFKNRLDICWRNHPLKFDFEALWN